MQINNPLSNKDTLVLTCYNDDTCSMKIRLKPKEKTYFMTDSKYPRLKLKKNSQGTDPKQYLRDLLCLSNNFIFL